MDFLRLLFLVCVCLQSGLALQSVEPAEDEIFNLGVVKSLKHCIMQKEKMDCLKKKVIEKIDEEIKKNRTIEITDGVILRRDSKDDEENSVANARSLQGLSLNEILSKKVNDYIKNVVVQFKMNDSMEEGRKRKQRYWHLLLFGAAGIFGFLGHLFVGKVAVMSGAALMIAKIALVIAMLSGLKNLKGNEKDHVVYTDHGGHHGGWSRSALAQDMAFRNQRPRPYVEVNPGYSVYDEIREQDPSGK